MTFYRRVFYFEVVFKFVDVHDRDDGQTAFLEDDVFFADMHPLNNGAEIDWCLGYGKVADQGPRWRFASQFDPPSGHVAINQF